MPRPSKVGRDYGGGSCYQRGDGLWIATIEAGWSANGKRRRIQVSAKTEDAVKVKLREKRRALEIAGDTNVDPRATIKSWAGEWLPIVERKQRPQTYRATGTALRKWIVPTLGHKRFAQLNPADIRAVAKAQRDAGLTSSTQLRTHAVLMSLLKAAALEGHPIPERIFKTEAPEKAVSDRKAMTVPESVAILQASVEHLPHASRTAAALLQGMRQGEALGLTWEEVDLEANALRISWQLQPLPYRVLRDRASGFRVPDGYEVRQLKGRWHLVRPKSKAGWRVIPLVPWMVMTLKAWEKVAPKSEHGLVWPALDGGPVDPKSDDIEWYGLQEAAQVSHPAGRYYTVHEARHTTATLLLEAKVDPAVIVAILGHSSILTSQGYMHVDTRQSLDAIGQVAERLQLTPPGAA